MLRRGLAALPLALFVILAAIFFRQLASDRDPSAIPSALIGQPAPAVDAVPLEGLLKDAEPVPAIDPDWVSDKVTVVNVWASWCGPCRAEHPYLMELAKRDDITVVGINHKDATANAVRFLGTLGNPFSAVSVDDDGTTSIDWGVYGVPETFIVARDGTIAYKQVGPLSRQIYAEIFLPELERALAR